MANTTNLDLVKPAGTDKALVSVINANSDKIDAFAGTTNQAISTLNSKIASQLGNLNISFNGTLGGNVIDIMNSANIGITYYRNSNQPTNRPSGCDWGTYILFKSSSTSVGVLYFDYSHFAFNYSINPTTATSISWTIL